ASCQSFVFVDSRIRLPFRSRYTIHKTLPSLRGYMEPSCLLGLGNSHLLFECCAEGLEIRLQESDVAAHHAEMGNLLSLYPKIHCLDADAQVHCGVAHRQRNFAREERETRGWCVGRASLGEVLWTHAYLYGISAFPPKALSTPKFEADRRGSIRELLPFGLGLTT